MENTISELTQKVARMMCCPDVPRHWDQCQSENCGAFDDDRVAAAPAIITAVREECAQIAENFPSVMIQTSPSHVRGLRGSDIAVAIRKFV